MGVKTLVIDSIGSPLIKEMADMMQKENQAVKVIDTRDKKISPCIGCNNCWLKTPGVCSIKDDYEELLKAMLLHDRIILVGAISLGFIDYRLKNIVDRILPIATMMIHIVDGEQRHVPRYDKHLEFGLLYDGDGNREYLNDWMERFALNVAATSLGAYPIGEYNEVAAWKN